METITNLASTAASTASKLIYGEQPADTDTKKSDVETKTADNETGGKEPLSGEQGKGTPAEPFDQGNLATPLATSESKSTFLDYGNKTAGKEPVSGEQGKGTVSEPFDQGNDGTKSSSAPKDDFLKLNPTLDGPQTDTKTHSSGDPKIYTSRNDATYTGMPIVPLNPDVATSGPTGTSSATPTAIGTSTITDKTGVTDKLWKETPIDDISRSGAPGAGPSAPAHVTPAVPDSTSGTGPAVTSPDPAIKTAAPDSVTAASDTYSSNPTTHSSTTDTHHGAHHIKDAVKDKTNTENSPEKTTPIRNDTPAWTDTGVPSKVDPSSVNDPGAAKGVQFEEEKSSTLATSPSNDEKGSKMSHLKDKLKDKLHIGHKDK